VEIIAALQNASLYGIVDLGYVRGSEALDVTRKMLAGGVQIIQLRAKNLPAPAVASLARELAPACRAAGVPFLLNDHPALVAETGADGAHVGQDDLGVAEARALAGPGKIIGKSTHSLVQAEAAAAEQPDYIGFGPLFATPTKPDYPAIGVSDIAAVHARVSLPIFCIGGVKKENLAALAGAGARRVVIVSGILQAPDIEAYCRECLFTLSKPN
jgi:thiamine-phosphate pyrophosphorylase